MSRNTVLSPKRQRDIERANPGEVTLLGEATFITLIIVLAQSFILWKFIDSVTLKSDTMHAFSDLFINVGAFAAVLAASRVGKVRGDIIKRVFAYVGIVMLFASALWVAKEAYGRLSSPVHIMGGWLMVTGIIGGAGNFWVHRILMRIPSSEHNHTHAVLDAHVLSDMVLSMIVVLAGLVTYLFKWHYADPALSIIAAVWMIVISGVLLHGMHQKEGHHCDHHH